MLNLIEYLTDTIQRGGHTIIATIANTQDEINDYSSILTILVECAVKGKVALIEFILNIL